MTSRFIRRFCTLAQRATAQTHGAGPLRRYQADLVVPTDARAEVAVLKAVTFVHVMRGNDRRYDWERGVIQDVVDGLLAEKRRLQPPYQLAWDATEDPDRRLRIVVDQVASLTDLSIVRWRDELVSN